MALGKKSQESAVVAKTALTNAKDLVGGEYIESELVESEIEVGNESATDTGTAAAETAAAETAAPQEQPAKEKAKPANTVLAPRQAAGLPAAGGRPGIGMALAELKNRIPALDFGTLPRFKSSTSGIKGEEGTLGHSCDVTIVSFNDQYAVSPCEDGAPKELCKFSLDGVNLSDGSGTVADHIADMKEEGYAKAASKRYIDLIAILDDAEKEHDEIGNMVTFSLSPMSVKSFERYCLQSTVKMQMDPKLTSEMVAKVTITAKPKSFNNKDFMMFDFSARR